jgi:dihydroorotate dehydrogenase (fumarate)
MTLASSMLGLRIAHPFVAGASPLGRDLDTIRRLEDGGAAAIVLPSLFEEQVTFAVEDRIRHMDPYDKQWSG